MDQKGFVSKRGIAFFKPSQVNFTSFLGAFNLFFIALLTNTSPTNSSSVFFFKWFHLNPPVVGLGLRCMSG